MVAESAPILLRRAEYHLGGEDRIDFERGEDRLAARGSWWIATRQPLDCKQDGFLPCRLIEYFRLQFLAPCWDRRLRPDPALDRMRGVPFLKLLVLE